MRKKLVIAFDQDRPLANLEKIWLETYNKEWNDNMALKDWTDWDLSKLVKAECGEKIYNIIRRPGFYRFLPIADGAQGCVKYLVETGIWDICFASASPREAYTDKRDWFGENFPFVDPDEIIFVGNKRRVNADFLIDDKPENLATFDGIPILFDAPWNTLETKYIRVYDHTDIKNLFDWVAGFMCDESDTKMLKRAMRITRLYIMEDLKNARRGEPYKCRY